MTSEVEERPNLVMGSYCWHGSQWVNKKAKNPNFAEFLVFLGLFGIGFANLSQKDPSFGKLGHVINPLTPEAFCEKGISWTFWWFLGWITAKLALIWSKMHLHHDSSAFLPLASHFATFLTRACAEIKI